MLSWTNKLKIITAYDLAFEDIGNLSASSSKIYAQKWGYTFEAHRVLYAGRPAAWSKIFYLIKEIESSKYDYLLWVDADAFFIRTDLDVLANIPNSKDIFLVKHMCTIGSIDDQPGLYLQADRPNSGVMLVKCTDWSLNFFKCIWGMVEYLNHPWWEQAALHKLLGFNFEISGGKEKNNFDQSLMSRVAWLSGIWNCVPTSAVGDDGDPVTKNPINPVIIHYAGMPNERRLEKMRLLAENLQM